MAPNLWDSTTISYPTSKFYITHSRGPYEIYIKSGTRYESYEYNTDTGSGIYWSHHHKYNTSYTISLMYPSKEIERNVKKLLKKMAETLCREGWISHVPYYLQPKLKPISLRGVRYDGRGWARR